MDGDTGLDIRAGACVTGDVAGGEGKDRLNRGTVLPCRGFRSFPLEVLEDGE